VNVLKGDAYAKNGSLPVLRLTSSCARLSARHPKQTPSPARRQPGAYRQAVMGAKLKNAPMKRCAAILLPILLLAAPKTPLDWQTGKIMDAKSGQYEPLPGGKALPDILNILNRHGFTDYAIETDKYEYIIELKGSAHVIINDQVKFATDKDVLWFIDADNKQRKTKILRQTLKEPGK